MQRSNEQGECGDGSVCTFRCSNIWQALFPKRGPFQLCQVTYFLSLVLQCFVWSDFSVFAGTKLNGVYMRVLRRIAGWCCYDASSGSSNRAIRSMLGVPSVECYVSRLRLGYLVSLLSSQCSPLRALLFLDVPLKSRKDKTRRLSC